MGQSDNLKRIARISAWVLLAGIIVLLITGWGITRTEIIYKASFGLINRGVADDIHRAVNFPLAAFFLLHVLINARLRLDRSVRAWVSNTILTVIGAGLLLVVFYMEYLT